jgi:myo-inositol-1(or 4)-monophosphatase
MSEMRTIVDTVAGIARIAGDLLIGMQAMPRVVDEKGRADLVTDADRAAEALVVDKLTAAFPGAHLLLEEGGARATTGTGHESLLFVVDPVDGTTNYAAGNPHFAVSIGVVRKGELAGGVIVDPWRGETFLAVRGEGAWLFTRGADLGRRLAVTTTAALRDTVLASGFPYTRYTDHDDNHAEFVALNLLTRGCRRNGAATLDLAWVAAGRYDGYWEQGLKPWDLAAGLLLVEEAGGRATDYAGGPVRVTDGRVVTTNGHIHEAVIGVLARVRANKGA